MFFKEEKKIKLAMLHILVMSTVSIQTKRKIRQMQL